MFGARSVIFIHRGVSEARAQALRKQGAEVIRAGADYDESVSITSSEANENGWTVVSDTSYAGYTATPATIMRGYTLMMKEIDEALEPGERPSHIIVQCGVGALAAAVAAFAVEVWQSGMAPKIVVVEPSSAACLFESAKAGRLVRCKGSAESFMAGLACGVPSLIGWNILRSAANFFMTAPDSLVAGSMRQLGEGHCGDIPIVAGESAVAGVMLLKYARAHLDIFDMLGLAKDSRVLVFGTEGDTDPVIYQEVLSGLRD
jgi:diaminopropionate ammonia-lyase